MGAVLFTRVLQSVLFHVKPTDPVIFMAIVVLLLGVVLLAGYIPARRATKVEPVTALRYQ
jgi:ABC-type lipoprotein release transport system permease subunit